MPTTADAGLSFNVVRTRVGEGYSQELLAGSRTRWTYLARLCADGVAWCLATGAATGAERQYSIVFSNTTSGSLLTATPWARLIVGIRNASSTARYCENSFAWTNEGAVNSGYMFSNVFQAGQSLSMGLYVNPNSTVRLVYTCYQPGSPTVDRVQRTQDVMVNRDTETLTTLFIGPSGPVLE